MIPAIVYLFIILFFLYKNGLFGIFTDKSISPTQFSLFFLFKCLAIPVFYYVYEVYYGGIKNYDAGNFFKDSKIINDLFYDQPFEYIKLLLGAGDPEEHSYVFKNYIARTGNWDEGISWRIFFNDNRSLIRIHSLIHFISFNSYYVHALISCLIGYIGAALIYRSLKHHFISKEVWLLAAFVFLPNLWLFSGALLKEPLVILNIGLILFFIDKVFERNHSWGRKTVFSISAFFAAYYLKPQIGITVFTLYLFYKITEFLVKRHKTLWYMGSVMVMMVLINLCFWMFKDMSMTTFINKKQAQFYDVAKGGIFLKDSSKFVRLLYNYDQLVKLDTSKHVFKIKKNVPFYYWEHTHQKDTLFCLANTDTITQYLLVYDIVPARSGYSIAPIASDANAILTIIKGVFKALGFPYRFDGLIGSVVSIESLLLSLCLLLSMIGAFFVKEKNILLFFLLTSVFLLILFGIATPNLGAIVRYRSVISPFIVLSFLYCINHYESRGVRKKS